MTQPGWFLRWKKAARNLQIQTYALYLAYRHPDVPWYARVFTLLVVAYAFSPVDLIPDFIPVLGYLDDLILIPAGVALALKMIPAEIMTECRARSTAEFQENRPVFRVMGWVIVLVWVILAVCIGLAVYRGLNG